MLRVGIIGLGGISYSHGRSIAELDEVEIVAVADLLPGSRDRFANEFGVEVLYASHTELLADKDVDAVAITLGHQLHHRLTIDALNAGKHVLVEKPMALSLDHCDEMIAAARRNGVKLTVGLNQRFLTANQKAHEVLDSGELGPVITAISHSRKNWGIDSRRPQYRSRYHGGGYWISVGCHIVDRLSWLVGSQVSRVKARIGTKSHYQAGDDYAVAFLDYKNGVPGVVVCVGYKTGAQFFGTEIICAGGALRLSGTGEQFVEIGRNEKWERVPIEKPPPPMFGQWRAFARAIADNLEPAVSTAWARHIMEILLAAETSSITGAEVELATARSWIIQEAGEVVGPDGVWY